MEYNCKEDDDLNFDLKDLNVCKWCELLLFLSQEWLQTNDYDKSLPLICLCEYAAMKNKYNNILLSCKLLKSKIALLNADYAKSFDLLYSLTTSKTSNNQPKFENNSDYLLTSANVEVLQQVLSLKYNEEDLPSMRRFDINKLENITHVLKTCHVEDPLSYNIELIQKITKTNEQFTSSKEIVDKLLDSMISMLYSSITDLQSDNTRNHERMKKNEDKLVEKVLAGACAENSLMMIKSLECMFEIYLLKGCHNEALKRYLKI